MKKLKILFALMLCISLFHTSCKEDPRLCVGKEGEECVKGFIFLDGDCRCPTETHYQLGQDLPEEYCALGGRITTGACYKKIDIQDSIRNYLLYTDCGCTQYLEGPDTFLITFNKYSKQFETKILIQDKTGQVLSEIYLTGLSPAETGVYYWNKDGGDRFIIQRIFTFGTSNVECSRYFDPSITGTVLGRIEGQFNQDDSECFATFYWDNIKDGISTHIDSCSWHIWR